jgi:hypothetical protein
MILSTLKTRLVERLSQTIVMKASELHKKRERVMHLCKFRARSWLRKSVVIHVVNFNSSPSDSKSLTKNDEIGRRTIFVIPRY